MKKKFKIMYPNDHHEPDKRGKPFKPYKNQMVVMNGSGVFFIYEGHDRNPSIRPLSQDLPKYDVVWKQ